jgi:hypothetical protein
LNLFLALLLSSFGASNLSAPQVDNDTNKLTEAFNRISRFKRWVRRSISNGIRMIRSKLTNQISDQRAPGEFPSFNKQSEIITGRPQWTFMKHQTSLRSLGVDMHISVDETIVDVIQRCLFQLSLSDFARPPFFSAIILFFKKWVLNLSGD